MEPTTDISIIVPFLNEEDNIPRLGEELNRFTSEHPEIRFEIVLVDDGSTDHSVETVKSTAFPAGSRLISLSQNFGSHAALRAGIQHARGAFITFLYADLQDPIENVTRMHEKAVAGAEIVWAHRGATQNSFFEKKFSAFYSRLMQKYVNRRYPDKGFDVVMFNRKVADAVNRNVENNSSVFLQILNMGFRQDFVEYQKAARKAGKSKWTVSKKIKLLIDSFVGFSYAPIRLVSIVGILFFVGGVVWTSYIILRKLFFNDLLSGWPALVSILTIGFGITNISLGIIAEYLWRTLDASRKRPVFLIDEITELDKS
jgi:glycosyltransferase involved in cell wall biosynthesis